MPASLSSRPAPGHKTTVSVSNTSNTLFGFGKTFEGYLSYADRIQLSLKRAKAIIEAHGTCSSLVAVNQTNLIQL